MADKSFGIKELNLIGASGTPTITSPNNLNLNASNVAISTDVTIGRHLDVDGHAEFDNVNIAGVSTFAGNILVGTTTPGPTAGEQLTIANSTNSGITIRSGTTAAGSILFEDDTADRGEIQYSHNGDYMRFKTVGTECMRLTANGSFKATKTGSYYGVSNNEHELVQDTNGVWVARAVHSTSTAGANAFGIIVHYNNSTPNSTSSQFFYALDSTAVRFEVRSNGGIANYQSNNANLCDEREKKNIVDLDSTWNCLKHWELKEFHYNEDADTDDKRYGVIAQQVAEHCPEVITDWVKQKAEEAVLDDDGNVVTEAKEEIVRMGVKEQQMMWMAIKALQEAQTRIETLETANAALEARITALEEGAN